MSIILKVHFIIQKSLCFWKQQTLLLKRPAEENEITPQRREEMTVPLGVKC